MTELNISAGELVRAWRRKRRFSQLDLACEAEVSTRHLSFIEGGKSAASRDMLLRLAERLRLPLREQNRLLLAGGYAPAYSDRGLNASDLKAALQVVETVLAAHNPFPALAIDRNWNLVAANDAIAPLLAGVAPHLLAPPVNILKLSLAPAGLASNILNFPEWRQHLLSRLVREAEASGSDDLFQLLEELDFHPSKMITPTMADADRIAVTLRLRHPGTGNELSLLSTTTVFGTATNVTLAELSLECFYPADDATRRILCGS